MPLLVTLPPALLLTQPLMTVDLDLEHPVCNRPVDSLSVPRVHGVGAVWLPSDPFNLEVSQFSPAQITNATILLVSSALPTCELSHQLFYFASSGWILFDLNAPFICSKIRLGTPLSIWPPFCVSSVLFILKFILFVQDLTCILKGCQQHLY